MRRKKRLQLLPMIILMIAAMSLTVFLTSRVTSEEPENFQLIVVEQGDTLWSIAREHRSPDEDIRNLVHNIRRINNLQSAVIYPGDKILIPCTT